jgi:hypothetical protein
MTIAATIVITSSNLSLHFFPLLLLSPSSGPSPLLSPSFCISDTSGGADVSGGADGKPGVFVSEPLPTSARGAGMRLLHGQRIRCLLYEQKLIEVDYDYLEQFQRLQLLLRNVTMAQPCHLQLHGTL